MLKPEENWFDFANLYEQQIDVAKEGAVFVEVGCWLGRSIIHAAQYAKAIGRDKDLQIICVDTFDGGPSDYLQQRVREMGGPDAVHEQLRANLKDHNVDYVKSIKATSVEVAEKFEGLADFVFIDAAHTYANVKEDIEAWLPKVRKGGTLAGHDYTEEYPAVKTAVRECFENYSVHGNCWLVRA